MCDQVCFMRRSRIPLLCLSLLLAACGSDGNDNGVDILDPATFHYGKTYGEWAAEWVHYVYSDSPPECENPITDPTGAHCRTYQDLTSPVFFLAGNFGGVSHRSECPVPEGKALFFPLLMVWGDNAGTTADRILSDDGLKRYAQSNFDTFERSSLRLLVDGHSIPALERGAIPRAPYVAHMEAGKNPYACMGIEDVEGDFPGYVTGYWAMLAPLPPGPHSIAFRGHVTSTMPNNDVRLDVTYTFDLP
jgi:hypothetical protein